MNYMEAEELATLVVGLPEDASDAAIEEALYTKFEVSMEQFHSIAKALIPFTVPAQAGVSGRWFQGFTYNGYFISKKEVE